MSASWSSRRSFLALVCSLALGSGLVSHSSAAQAFGDSGAFRVRLLAAGSEFRRRPADFELWKSGAARWAFEVVERTSAPGSMHPEVVEVESSNLVDSPFLVWPGSVDPGALSALGIRRLREFLRLGGMLIVDERDPARGEFRKGAEREILRALPDAAATQLAEDHVIFKSFYILDRPYGKVEGPRNLRAILRGKMAQVLFLETDLLGALARNRDTWAEPVSSGSSMQRERAIRFAVNLALYVLCTDYKDDQVHAPFLMRRRAGSGENP